VWGKCCTSIVRGRILCRGVDSVIKHACIKKTAGISWGFHISHRDLTAASGRKNVMAGEALRDLVCILSGEDGAGAGVDTVEDDDTGVCKYAPRA
jgi:hypothetical protein